MGRILRTALVVVFAFAGYQGLSQNVVISEVYGGGGNVGATHKNDFIELYNPTAAPISLVGWSVQYGSSSGTTWAATNLTGTIAPGGYFLIQEAAGAGNGVTLPTVDVSGALAMSATAGKVALVSSTTLLSGAVPTSPNVVDMIGYGAANWFEGAATPALTNSTAAERKIPCVDSNNNANDFKSGTATPQNSTQTISPPGFTATYPKVQSITPTGFQLVTNLDNIGATYFVILTAGATAPTSLQVKSGQDGSGNVLSADFKGSMNVTAATTEFSTSPANLASLTSYDIYLITERCVLSAAPVLVQATTLSAADLTPPNNVSGYPKAQSATSTGFQVATKIDEGGKTYFVVLINGSAAPSALQVKAGQDGAGATLAANLIGQITVASANTEYTSLVTGLSASTDYNVYFASEDVAPNLQTSVSQVSISTTAPPIIFTENFNTCNGNVSSFTQVSVTGPQFWDCTTFGNNTSNGVQINAGTATGSTVNEDWLISPPITLLTGAAVSFDNRKDFNGLDLAFKISADYDGVSAPASATWSDLSFTKSTNTGGSGTWVSSGAVDLTAYNSLKVYVAFVYISGSTANTGARWGIDNFSVTNATAAYITTSANALSNFGYAQSPNVSAAKSFTFLGKGLLSDVTINAPANFEVSRDGSAFGSSASFTIAEALTSQTVYVRFAPSAGAGAVSGSISLVSGSVSRNVSVSGTEGVDPRSSTFDVATYNLEFFGTDVKDAPGGTEFGPIDDALQIANVTTVLQTIGADVFAVEEIADDNAFDQLVANLPGYSKVVANRWSYYFDPPDPFFPPQKIAFIYNTSTVQVVSTRVMFSKLYEDIRAGFTLPGYPTTSTSFWSSGRLPFMLTLDVTINGITNRVRMIDIHAKSGSAAADYNRRLYDVQVLHDSLTANYPNDKIILLGDFNDNVEGSIYAGHTSTYKPFVDNTSNYNVLTYNLSVNGGYTFPSSGSFLDHIIMSNDMTSMYVPNSISIEDPRNYITNYTTTTSDHLPVKASFLLIKNNQTITFDQPAAHIYGDAPFNLTASSTSNLTVSFVSSDPSIASVSGNTVTILKAGTVDITASQGGNTNYNAAPDVVHSLVINKTDQTIAFTGPLPVKTFGDPAFGLTASSTSLLPVTFSSSAASVATINGSTVTITGGGSTTITALQGGDANFNAATGVGLLLTVNPANQTITFGALADKTLGDPSFALTATTTSPLVISYGTTSDKITLNGSQVTIVKAGRATIRASQTGNANFNAATPVDQSFCIKPAKPTVALSNANTATPILTSSATAGNQWYLNGTIINGATNTTLNVTGIGVYKVQVKVDDCISVFSNDTPIIFTGDLIAASGKAVVYPNPVIDYIEIRGIENEIISSHVIDMMGRSSSMILEKNGETHRGLVSHLYTGIYFLRIHEGSTIHLTKFIKN